jgi:filamentous hemagglutinin
MLPSDLSFSLRSPPFAHVMLVHALVLLLLLTPCTQAGDILHMGGAASGTTTAAGTAAAGASAINTAAATAQAHANAQDMLARNTLALQAVTAMQSAAHAAAAGASNLGANPNYAGQTLPNVPNGLGTGGLDIIGAPSGANAPQQSLDNAHTIVTIQQTAQQALLNWKTFNVGSDTTVVFDQSAGGAGVGTWIAFNTINDSSGNPTQILGSIQAQGQVYLINQNGIIFGAGSQVNTHAMVASALPLNNNLVTRGLLNNPDSQFLFSADAQPAGANGTPAYTPPSVPAFGKIGSVIVQAGAQITAPTSSANVGGLVALIGPNVTNNGTISTPDGQTILAAGMQVGLDAHDSADPSLRGLDVYVGDVGSYGGTATNAGLIEAPRGSVVITGKNVNQNGFIDSTTSAALNGRIDLLANYNAISNTNYNASQPNLGKVFIFPSGSTGIVRTGADSVMQILPEYASNLTVVGTQLALPSQINMQGLGIYLGTNSVILAPNANVALSAGVWDLIFTQGSMTALKFVEASGQVYLDQGAVVDVAGSTAVAASISDYIITVKLAAAELADSALQRSGSLRGQSITVDLREHGVRADGSTWVGTPLANLSGYVAAIQRNVGQLTVAGGTVTIKAGESAVMQSGAWVDVSGGYLDYAASYVQTTVLSSHGQMISLANAQRDVLYDGIYNPATSSTDPRWGTTSGTSALFAAGSHYENAHSVGGNGGTLAIYAPAMALDGTLQGSTITGLQQLESAPLPSSLVLYFEAQQLDPTAALHYPYYSPTPPTVTFSNSASGLPAANAFTVNGSGVPVALSQARRDSVVLSPTLLTMQGFGSLTVDDSNGNISLPAGVTLTAPLAGSITLKGANVDIEGSITAPAGTISITAYDIDRFLSLKLSSDGIDATPSADPTRGLVTIGAAAYVSTSGVVIDNRPGSPTRALVPSEVTHLNTDGTTHYVSTTAGGSISIQAYTAELTAGSVLDVSGGFEIAANGGITYSNAGTLTLEAGNDPYVTSVLGGHLTLDATLNGFSGASGGSLTLLAPMIQVGGTLPDANALLLLPNFFNQGGFANFQLIGLGINSAGTVLPGVLITAGTTIRPQVLSLQANTGSPNGTNTLTVGTLLQPEGYRPAATLLLKAPGIHDFFNAQLILRGEVATAVGSLIETDARGSVSINAQTVELFGGVLAPGGTINVTGSAEYPQINTPTNGYATVHLGATSLLSTAGTTVLLQNAFGLRTGYVYNGGTLTVSGSIVADAGAVLDVSGTTAILDLLPQQAGQATVNTAGLSMAALFPGTAVTQPVQLAQSVPTQIDSNGGSLTLIGGDFLFSNATLKGHAGGHTAMGGSLTVQSDRFIVPGSLSLDSDIRLQVAQDMAQFVQPVFASGHVIGQALVGAGGSTIKSMGYFGANSFTAGGFDNLTLPGNVQFVGPVNLSAAGYLKVAEGGVLAANDLVSLTAPYVALGQPLAPPLRDVDLTDPFKQSGNVSGNIYFSPTYGTGRLVITADLLEIGFLSLQNIGQATLTAQQDLRGSGYLDMAGDLTLVAGQIYPVTASTFTITAYNYTAGGVAKNGSVTIASSGETPQFPLSGGGRLNIYATTITQGGTLRAPLGTITLGWDGTGTAPKGLVTNTSVPVTQQITLPSGGITSVSAIDPQTGAGVVIPYGIVVNGTNWIDPTGYDITTIGAPDKTIKISGANITTEAGSSIDIRGGGELYGYQWVPGNGGTNDILNTTGSYAILPGYAASFAPFAPYATSGSTVANLGGDPGYANSTLAVGERVYLQAAHGLAAGVYTLLPARYALLPGAMLVTPDVTSTLTTGQVKPDGSLLTNGYLFNSLNPNVSGNIYQQFEVAPLSVVKVRADYVDYAANVFIPAAQQTQSQPVTLTSNDAGYALLNALQTMQLNGGVTAGGYQTGRGGRVDVSSPLDIVLAAPGAPAQPGKLLLNTTLLSSWNAESLLIGGVRTFANGSTTVTVKTTNLTLDNAGAPLTGSEIILAATGTLTLAANSVLTQTSAQSAADTLIVSGNGTLVRVSGVASAQISRTGVTTSNLPQLNIGTLAHVSGASVTLDSSNATTLDLSAVLSGQALNLNSGRISIQLNNPGALQPSPGLVLGGTLLSNLQAASALSLLSYSAIDLYGTGTFAATGSLALHAAEIRAFNNNNTFSFTAPQSILLDNSANGTAPGSAGLNGSTLALSAATITIGRNNLTVDQFSQVTLSASDHLFLQGAGSLSTQGGLSISTPYITAASASTQAVNAAGVLTMTRPGAAVSPTGLPVGAQVSFTGASINANTDILLPSGALSLHALTGNLAVSGRLDTGGVAATFYDVIKYTDAGSIFLTADLGAVTIAGTSTVSVSAAAAGGNAGTFTVSAPTGLFTMNGALLGTAGTRGTTGTAVIDVGSLVSFTALNDVLNNGMFTASRTLRIRSGSVTVSDTVNAQQFMLSVDQGDITVNGTINAAGHTGGSIDLIASGSVLINSGALLTVAAQAFDAAGKGGTISLEAGSYVNNTINTTAILDIHAGSTIDLSVSAYNATSALNGQFAGTLHLRAPQSSSTEVTAIQAIGGTILNASSIRAEGYAVYDLTGSGLISSTVQSSINTNGTSFGGNSTAISTRLLTGNASAAALSPLLVVMPGAEVVNRTGGLTLGTPTSPVSSDWDLSTFHYGPKGAPGVLTLLAAGDLTFYNTLSDGFKVLTAAPLGYSLVERMWLATLQTQNTSLPVNTQSWSFRMAAGADFSAANFRDVIPTMTKSGSGSTNILTLNNVTGVVVGETVTGTNISSGTMVAAINGNQITLSQNLIAALPASTTITFGSSLVLGKNGGQAIPSSGPGSTALTRLAINPTNGTNVATTSNLFQVIRTGTGDINIFVGKDVQLLNQFATIYTAGVSVPSATTIFSAGDFVLPNVTNILVNQGNLGSYQQPYAAQYSLAGGSVTVEAGEDIIHLTRDSLGNLIPDSSRELPNNWLMRRGYVDGNGNYGVTKVSTTSNVITGGVTDSATSTSWWINFSNFFDGVAALGGGNVTLKAGRDVQNVSAHAPTNARAAKGTPSTAGLLELGGGDVTVIAGHNIDGGIYYVERGTGNLQAGGQITTNSTRSPSQGLLGNTIASIDSEATWLPTTLFVGKSTFDVSARGNVLLGPVANTFLLPQGLNNRVYYKTYFSTYAANSAVSVTSLGGNITFRQVATSPNGTTAQSILSLWMDDELLLQASNSSSAANYQPWLRLVETSTSPFNTLSTLMPGSLNAVAYSGDINLVGTMTLSPSPTGTLELLANGSVNGLQSTGVSTNILASKAAVNGWASATVNLSDANPASIPGVLTPFAFYQTYYNPLITANAISARNTTPTFMDVVNSTFKESGSTTGINASTQVKQKLHAAGLLHADDTTPVRIYAAGGSLSGLTLYSAKFANILAKQDITDISFYIQNVRSSDISVVSSGRDIIAYDSSSPLRTQAISPGNYTVQQEVPKSGDIQISGPGTLQVLAGRNLNLGTGSNNSDGTGVGITSIGNGRNPYLPFTGADLILAAGMGKAAPGIGETIADLTSFIAYLTSSPEGDRYLAEAKGILGVTPDYSVTNTDGVKVSTVAPGSPAALAGIKPGDTILKVGGKTLTNTYDDTFLLSGLTLGTPTTVTILRNGIQQDLSITPGSNLLNLTDPALTAAQQQQLALSVFYLALRDAGRDHNDANSPNYGTYKNGFAAIATLFPTTSPGGIQTQARDIRTKSGGNISILAPDGGLQLAPTLLGQTLAPPGIITEAGGSISIFANNSVNIGISRIFTLRGGDIDIWSSTGDIAAGSSSKTVQSAPPTRVLIDPQSANVFTDLAGLATGGGIGVLATVAGVKPANVDLIAPVGAVDAGDAGIRATGNLNIAATIVLNAANISVGGTSGGTPAAVSVSAPSLGSVSSAASSAGAATTATASQAAAQTQPQTLTQDLPSIITVEVIGYGGSNSGDDDDERKRKLRNQPGE